MEAEKGYREVLFRDPGHLKARNNLGYVYDSRGEPARALEEYQAALEIEPENVQLLNNVGAVLGTLGKYGQAEETLRTAQLLAPEDPDVHLNLGLVFFRKGLYTAARESLERAIVLDPESESAYYYLGEACNRLGQIDTGARGAGTGAGDPATKRSSLVHDRYSVRSQTRAGAGVGGLPEGPRDPGRRLKAPCRHAPPSASRARPMFQGSSPSGATDTRFGRNVRFSAVRASSDPSESQLVSRSPSGLRSPAATLPVV